MRRRDITFAGGGLDRASHLRGDSAGMAALRAGGGARVLPLWRGKVVVAGADDPGHAPLGWLPPAHPALTATAEPPVFLGLIDGAPRFAADLYPWEPEGDLPKTLDAFADPSEQVHPAFPARHRFCELRNVMNALAAVEAEAAATARALINWHARHRFCANCGAATQPAQAGWQRDCAACGTQHYPRTDPVVIMLITHGNSLLIGRSPGWPPGFYSLLAGFVEPGEAPEAAVRREVMEEAGIAVGPVRYLASQPWPYPSSLMMAFRGRALTAEITVDATELQDARWVTREEMLQVLAGDHPELKPARPGAIARWVMTEWLADRLEEIDAWN